MTEVVVSTLRFLGPPKNGNGGLRVSKPESLEKRVGRKRGFAMVPDRGMVPICGKQNLATLRAYWVRGDFSRQMNEILYHIRVIETSDFGFWQEL